MTMKNVAFAAALLLGVTGCSGVNSDAVCEPGSGNPCNDEGQGQGAGLTFPSALQGVTWELVTVERASGEENLPNRVSSLVFAPTEVSGKTCNSYGARVKVATPALITSDRFLSTQMRCDGPAGDVDRMVQDVLAGGATWQRQDATLTLSGGGVTLTFTRQLS